MSWNWFSVSVFGCLLINTSFAGIAQEFHAQRSIGYQRVSFGSFRQPIDQWFLQRLDHANPSNPETWQQRYQVNDAWFRNARNSPIFLFVGGEYEIPGNYLLEGQAMTTYAKKHNALCLQLEHRFYGKSQPKEDLSVENLKYLSSEQALADIANFIKGMNKKYNFTQSNKWILFGGSYGGSLVAWARLKYPELIHAAVSSSAPLLAEGDFKRYNEETRRALAASSPKCAETVHQAAIAVEDLLKTQSGARIMSEKMHLCTPMDIPAEDELAFFARTLAFHFQTAVQNSAADHVCQFMTSNAVPDLIDRYIHAVFGAYFNRGGCLDFTFSAYLDQMRSKSPLATGGARAWLYQSCTEFGFFTTSSSREELFGSLLKLRHFINQCGDIFDETFDENRLKNGIERTNSNYGGLNITVSRVVFVQGSLDPWRVLGISESTDPEAPAIVINDASHCTDMWAPTRGEPPQLMNARMKIHKHLGEWLSSG